MSANTVDDARDHFHSLLEPGLSEQEGDPRVDVNPGATAVYVKAVLKERLQASGSDRLAVYCDGELIGIATRARVFAQRLAAGTAGDGDGAAFPLASTDYRALLFRCPRQHCSASAYASFFDERTNPVCPDHAGVAMRLVQSRPAIGAH